MSQNVRVRYMRLLVFFDLPVMTAIQRKRYAQFRKYLVKDGFLMLQQSVYSKLVVNEAAASGVVARLRKHRPPEGLVQVLKVTEKQYATMTYITGNESSHDEVDTMGEFLVL